jgi:hypothetical protein
MVIGKELVGELGSKGEVTQLSIETVDPLAIRLQGFGPNKTWVSSAFGLKFVPEM